MAEFGNFAMCLAWFLSLLGIGIGVFAGRTRRNAWYDTTRHATVLVAALTILSLFCLGILFLQDDYRVMYVWQFSQQDMHPIYKVTAIWGGMDGSMLLWCAALALCGGIVALRSRGYPSVIMPWVLAVMNSSTLFFLTIVVFLTNPFRFHPVIPLDGTGLNPLLQNPYMAIHPPMLYLGFTGLSVPYAFCFGALLSGHLNNDWIRLTRRWTLFAWACLTLGICLGGYWAYIELGWGGFWAWDPVENASFLPWLTSTAFLHSVMVQERKNMLRFWNVGLVVLSYGLTVFGTFLTRSGVVQSVHAFAATDVGWVFLVYLGLLFVATVALLWYRREELRSERKIESLLSREAAFLANNLVFLSICFATLWGVLFPVFSETLTNERRTVGIPFFNAVNIPLFLLLIFLMGVGPLIAWKKASLSSLRKVFFVPFVGGFIASGLLLFAGVEGFLPIVSYGLCFFVFLTIISELHRGARSQKASMPDASLVESTTKLLRRHRVRYGGYFIHFGVLVATVAITASMAHKLEKEVALNVGESFELRRYRFALEKVEERQGKNYVASYARVNLFSKASGELLAVLEPEQRFYPRGGKRGLDSGVGESTSEVAIYKSWRDDFYLVLAGADDSGRKMAFKIFINPLQSWLWLGVFLMACGTFMVIRPRRHSYELAVEASADSSAA